MDFKGKEQRRDPRVPFPCKVIITSSQGEFISHIEDISKGGIKVILEKELTHLSSVGLELFLRKDDSIKCAGRVVWMMGKLNPIDKTSTLYHTGIAFLNMSAADKERIKQIVASLLKKKLNTLDSK